MIIMSVDYGDVRTGIAVCDSLEMLASPVGVLTVTDSEELADKIVVLANERRAKLIVVGQPKNMDSSLGERAQKAAALADIIAVRGVETVLWDERLTTVSAHNYLNATDTRGKKRKAVVDAVSAVIILQDYLEFRKNANKTND